MIYLASSSPRRKDLLEQVHIPCTVVHSTYKEGPSEGEDPCSVVMKHALGKAQSVEGISSEEGLILGADTVVVLDEKIMGKPRDENEAKDMLRRLSGKVHKVITGVALCYKDWEDVFFVSTKVFFKTMTESDIDYYVKTGEPLDKAGAYGIQGIGALWVEKIEGSYSNVVGLPVEAVYERLHAWWCLGEQQRI